MSGRPPTPWTPSSRVSRRRRAATTGASTSAAGRSQTRPVLAYRHRRILVNEYGSVRFIFIHGRESVGGCIHDFCLHVYVFGNARCH
eukprot:scaffold76937_cov57-Phaeocystis_antarctica.AAC.1